MPFLIAAALLAGAQAAPATAPTTQRDVVVTARPLDATARDLAACIARHCPPDQDVAASLAHAENQFVAGDYRASRRTLLAAGHRDRRYAKAYPVPVSDLMRASSRVAAHLGETRDYRIDTIDSLDALRAGLPAGDPRVVAQRLEVADMFVGVGQTDAALDMYGDIRRDAHRLGLANLEGVATIRPVVIALRTGNASPDDRRAALRTLDRMIANPDPAFAHYALIARAVRAQYLARHGDGAPLDQLIAELRQRGVGTTPVLVYTPPVDLPGTPEAITPHDDVPVREALTRLPVGSFDKQWIDVAYWVKPDGTVGDVDVARQSADDVDAWDKPVLKAIAGRRYLPLSLPAGDPGALRVERYTYTSAFDDTVTGTRLRQRDGKPRLEMLDLTQEPAKGGDAAKG